MANEDIGMTVTVRVFYYPEFELFPDGFYGQRACRSEILINGELKSGKNFPYPGAIPAHHLKPRATNS